MSPADRSGATSTTSTTRPGTGSSPATAPERQVELPITGMTCASCAARIERKLNRLDGVQASVNYATEQAKVSFDPGRVTEDMLVDAVEQAGYKATLPPPAPTAAAAPGGV